jgi:hypothetical protein
MKLECIDGVEDWEFGNNEKAKRIPVTRLSRTKCPLSSFTGNRGNS